MNEDRFLLSLVTIAAHRGTRFVLREAESRELCDKWLCLMAGVTPQQLRNGALTASEIRKLRKAAKMLTETPVYVEGA
jgi:replicative DNA helicase